MSGSDLSVQWLGRQDYQAALETQRDTWKRRLDGEIADTLLLLEHEPVYTIGRTGDRSSLGPNPDEALPHPLVEISRGGQATYHGPGQLVGYVISDLRALGRDLHRFLRAIEESLISLCATYKLSASRREGLTGVWVEHRKLASIGIGVRRWVTMHGFAINVHGDLAPFEAITPCGIQGVEMTSLTQELPSRREISVSEVAGDYPSHLKSALEELADSAS